ncbi:MAG TPA: preprotein translocase subunit TatB [Desulfobacteraceae bacterium]|nr:preprotein translocase subunit TatB [Desulfobacteraceae bacterium]
MVDARGLSCPQPVLMTMNEIKKGGEDEIVVLVDTETSRENVSRAAASRGWAVEGIESDGDGFRLTIVKSK